MGLSEVRCMQTIRGPEEFAATFGAPREALERLVLYEKLLRQWQKAVNLVAPGSLDSIWHRHFADSAQLAPLAPSGTRSWIDLGSGAGFPGLVVAIMLAPPPPGATPTPSQAPIARGEGWGEGQEQAPTPVGQGRGARQPHTPASASVAAPHLIPLPPSGERGSIHFTLIESDARKCAFLREVARQTGITVDILSKRAESVTTEVNSSLLPRVVCARALAPLDRLFALALPLSPPGTTGVWCKGKEVERELEAARKNWNFDVALVPSVTDPDGRIAVTTNLDRKAKD
jgi:16S rRNA (guanine527-N7)-methyltransferase